MSPGKALARNETYRCIPRRRQGQRQQLQRQTNQQTLDWVSPARQFLGAWLVQVIVSKNPSHND